MAVVTADRAKELSTTTGTGAFTLAGAVSGFQSWATAFGSGVTAGISYCIHGGSEWEVGKGSFNGTTMVLTRTTVEASSNAGAAVNFSAGAKEVFATFSEVDAVASTTGGGGGSSAGERVKVDPTGLTWSWANQGSATVTIDGEALVLYGPADANESFRCRTIAVPSKPYSIIIHYKASQVLTNYSGVAMGWLSSGNSLTGFMHRSESGNLYWLVVKFTNLTTNSGVNYVNNVDAMEYFPWIKLSDAAGGNREIHGSATGLNDSWILLHSVATDDYLTPDRIFVAVNPRSAGWPIALTVDSVEEI